MFKRLKTDFCESGSFINQCCNPIIVYYYYYYYDSWKYQHTPCLGTSIVFSLKYFKSHLFIQTNTKTRCYYYSLLRALLIWKWMFKSWLIAVECLSVKLAHICANQGSFTGSSSHVSGERVKADRRLPAADHQPSAVLNQGWVLPLVGIETAVWCVYAIVVWWSQESQNDRHALVSGRPLPVQSSCRKSHSHTHAVYSITQRQQLLHKTVSVFWTGTQSDAAGQHSTKLCPRSYCTNFLSIIL